MPTSSIDLYQMQDSRNNFDAMRPAPVCSDDANQFMGQCQNVHISTNCYYGYHDSKSVANSDVLTDYEMLEEPRSNEIALPPSNARKRSADEGEYPLRKRQREEGTVPTASNNSPSFLRPTHNNPDISRCLMVHMI